MIGAFVGGLAKAAVTGAVGVAVINVLKESKAGDTLRDIAVTVTEVGVRGYKLVESGVEKVVDTVSDVFVEAKDRAEAAEAQDKATAEAVVEDPITQAENVVNEADRPDNQV